MTRECRIRVWLRGHSPLDYRADEQAARRFADAIRTMGARVVIDHDLTGDLRPLPCERLWAVA
jgi:hypothetical protein